MKQINFALVTSNSLMDKIPSWESYQNMDEDQYIDLINYSKELAGSNKDHKITFLVVAQGFDSIEDEDNIKKEQEAEKLQQSREHQESLRKKSKNILNSIYGI